MLLKRVIHFYYLIIIKTMNKVLKKREMTMTLFDLILKELSKKQIDVSGKLKFDQYQNAEIRLRSFLIPLETLDGNYTICLKGVIKASTEFDFKSKEDYTGFYPSYNFSIEDENGQRVKLTADLHNIILNQLEQITSI